MRHPKKKRKTEMTKQAVARQKIAPGDQDVWGDSVWGSRQAFIEARVQKEGYSTEAAERYADDWENALRELKVNKLQPLHAE